MKRHLVTCFKFKRSIPEELLDSLCTCTSNTSESIRTNPQRTIDEMGGMGHFAQKSTREIDRLAGMALFAGARPFSTFESVEMKEFHKALNPNYNTPSRQRLSESILDDCYAHIQDKVNQLLNKSQYLNVSVDETTDIRKRRIMNISVTDSNRSYCIALLSLEDEKMTAAAITNWTVEQVRRKQGNVYTESLQTTNIFESID